MKLLNQILFLLFNLFIVVIYPKNYDCSTKNRIKLKGNEIAFFETTNYPKLWSYNGYLKSNCNITFTLLDNEKNHWLFVGYSLVTNATTREYDTDFSIILNDTNIFNIPSSLFQSFFEKPYQYDIAFQGFIVFDDGKNKCPLESATKNHFEFDDEKQIIFLQSSFKEYHYRNYSCIWKFSAPMGYGFKIVFREFNSSSKFIVKNSTQVLVNERSVKSFFPYYNDDDFIQISLSESKSITKMEFQAYISIVKKEQQKVDGNCSITESKEGKIIWTNVNSKNGYKNNVFCKFELIIPSKTEVFVNMENELEKGVDYIKYFPDSNNDFKFIDDKSFIIQAHSENGSRSIFWEFISDGSYQLLGFWIYFQKMECKCANYIVNCDNAVHGIMEHNYIFYYYCGNLHCIFEILPCNTSVTLMEIPMITGGINDIFKIISNNVTVFELNYKKQVTQNQMIYLNSSNKNYFTADTYPSTDVKSFTFTIRSITLPNITSKFILSFDAPSFIIDTAFHKFFTIEISPELHNLNLTIFVYQMLRIEIFNNESLTYNLLNIKCFEDYDVFRCRSNKITIYITGYLIPRIVVVELSKPPKGCVFEKNTFIIASENAAVASIANSEADCDITLLISQNSFYMNLWTTAASSETLKIFAGDDDSNLFLEITTSSAKTWSPILLNSLIYKIRIPKSSAILINFMNADVQCDGNDACFSISQYPFKSLFSSTGYGLSGDNGNKFKLDIKNFSTKFTAINFKMNSDEYFYFNDQSISKDYFINKTGDFLIFKNQIITFFFYLSNNMSLKTGALFFVETIKETDMNEKYMFN